CLRGCGIGETYRRAGRVECNAYVAIIIDQVATGTSIVEAMQVPTIIQETSITAMDCRWHVIEYAVGTSQRKNFDVRDWATSIRPVFIGKPLKESLPVDLLRTRGH